MADQPNSTGKHQATSRDGVATTPANRSRKRYRSPTRRVITGLVKFLLVSYALVVAAMALMESRLVYPAAYFKADPPRSNANESDQSGVQSVAYDSTDGITLTGRLVEHRDASKIVLFFHGNGARAAWLDEWAAGLSRHWNATVMIAEYRGYEDDVEPTEKGVIDDCIAARDYLCERYDCLPDEIVLYGRSLGGGCAVAVASLGGARALILERTFDRLVDLAASKYPFLPINYLMKNRYDSIGRLVVYEGPLIQLHGTDDQIVPIDHGRRLFDSASCSPKHWIEIPALGHNGGLPASAMRELTQKLEEFIGSSTGSNAVVQP